MEYEKLIKEHADILEFRKRPYNERAYIEEFLKLAEKKVKNLNKPTIMPCISHFTDENGNSVDVCAGGVNVILKRDGAHEYFRSYGFAGRMKLTPVYVE